MTDREALLDIYDLVHQQVMNYRGLSVLDEKIYDVVRDALKIPTNGAAIG